MLKKIRIFFIPAIACGMILIFAGSCKKSKSSPNTNKVPELTTAALSNIFFTTADGGGTITNEGGSSISARGICWSESQTPTLADNKTSDGNGNSSFTSKITSLKAGKVYYVRAYATNNTGTGYGNTLSFTTQGASAGTITDADGNVYNTMVMGTQVWMVENLNTTKYNDATVFRGSNTKEVGFSVRCVKD